MGPGPKCFFEPGPGPKMTGPAHVWNQHVGIRASQISNAINLGAVLKCSQANFLNNMKK
jgi:hypothetical protein